MSCLPAHSCPQPPLVVIAPPAPVEDDTATGSVTGGTPSVSTTGFVYPVLAAGITIPAISSLVQATVTRASEWAAPGLLVWLPSHGGYLSVTGVSGNIVTMRNLSIAAGTVIEAGTQLIPTAPPQSDVAEDAQPVSEVNFLRGLSSELPVNLGGELGDTLWRGSNTWKRLQANPFRVLSSPPDLLTIKRDVTTFTPGSNTAALKWTPTGANVSTINAAAPTGTLTFPSYPEVEASQAVRALVQVNWESAQRTTSRIVRLKVTINGIVWQVQEYNSAVADPSSNFSAAIAERIAGCKAAGQDVFIIPVPAANAAANVSFEYNKAITTAPTSSDHANSHYIITFKVLGYYL